MSSHGSNPQDEIDRLQAVIQRQDQQIQELTSNVTEGKLTDNEPSLRVSKKRKAYTDARRSPIEAEVIHTSQQLAARDLPQDDATKIIKNMVNTANSALNNIDKDAPLGEAYDIYHNALEDISVIGTTYLKAASWEIQSNATRPNSYSETFNASNSTPKRESDPPAEQIPTGRQHYKAQFNYNFHHPKPDASAFIPRPDLPSHQKTDVASKGSINLPTPYSGEADTGPTRMSAGEIRRGLARRVAAGTLMPESEERRKELPSFSTVIEAMREARKEAKEEERKGRRY